MGFKLRSGNNPDFKSMGSSPSPKAKAAPYNQGTNEMTNERWSEMSDATQKRTGRTLNELVAARKNYEKGSPEYNAIQNEINKSYGVKKRHEQDKKTKVEVGGDKMVIKKKGGEDSDDTKIKTGTSKIAGGEGKTVIKTEDGESTQTRGPKADTGNEETKAAADDKKSGNRKADKQFKKYQKHQEKQERLEEKGKGDSKRATRQGKKADEAYEKYVEAGGDTSRV